MLDGSALEVAEAIHAQIHIFTVLALVPGTLVDAAASKRRSTVGGHHCRSGNNTDWMLDMHEAMHRRVVEHREARSVASLAQIIVGTVHALVTGTVDDVLARIAPIGWCSFGRG
jgi:hypothetical protein